MADPAEDDRDDALLRRLYDESDGGGDDGDLHRLRRLRGMFRDYARATEEEPPSRGLDELMAAARARVPQRPPATAAATAEHAAVEAPRPGFWARLRAWLAPIAAHPALASAAVVVFIAGIAGVLYVRGKTTVEERAAAPAEVATAEAQQAQTAPDTTVTPDPGMVAGLADKEDETAGAAPSGGQPSGPLQIAEEQPAKPEPPARRRSRPAKREGGGGGSKDSGSVPLTPEGKNSTRGVDGLDQGVGGTLVLGEQSGAGASPPAATPAEPAAEPTPPPPPSKPAEPAPSTSV